MSRLLSIAADLSAPPSSPTAFREVTLIASLRGYEVIAVCPEAEWSSYRCWLRGRLGLWDYLSDLLPDTIDIHPSVALLGGSAARLTAHNVHAVLAHIPA